MSVDLSKQPKQKGKVSLKKEDVPKGTVSLKKEEAAPEGTVSLKKKETAPEGTVSLKKEEAASKGTADLEKETARASAGVASQKAGGSFGTAGSAFLDAGGSARARESRSWIAVPVVGAALFLALVFAAVQNAAVAENEPPAEETAGTAPMDWEENETDAGEGGGADSFVIPDSVPADDPQIYEPEQEPEEDGAVLEYGEIRDETAIHEYEVITADVTWSEAFSDCLSRGGYLCRINSAKENKAVKKLLNEQKVRGVVYLGGLRKADSDEYHWIDEDGQAFGKVINAGKYKKFWYDGEPSFEDEVDGVRIEERYMAMIYISAGKKWLWNDVNDDVLSLSPDYYSGRISYICEYE